MLHDTHANLIVDVLRNAIPLPGPFYAPYELALMGAATAAGEQTVPLLTANAVVTVPDHPQAVSFNPTSMKDIKAADPGAQVNLIEAPRANKQGDARLSYPIEVPPGRQGL